MLVAIQQSPAEYDLQNESYIITVSENRTNVSPFCHT